MNRINLLFLSCLFSLCCTMSLPAKDKSTADPSPTPSSSTAEPEEKIDIPVPMGQEVKGIRIPSFNEKGEMTMEFQAETAMRESENLLKMNALTITIINPDEQEKTTVLMKDAIFNLDTRILSTKNQTIIRRDDAEIIGDSAEFDTKTRFSRMLGNVKMTISDVDIFNNPNSSDHP